MVNDSHCDNSTKVKRDDLLNGVLDRYWKEAYCIKK